MSGVDSVTWACRLWHLLQGEWSQGFLEMSTSLSKLFLPAWICNCSLYEGPGIWGPRASPGLCHHFIVGLWTRHFPFLGLNSLLNKMKKSFDLRDWNSSSCSFVLNLCSLGSLSSCLPILETGVYVQFHDLETPPPLERQMHPNPSSLRESGGLAQPASVYPSSGFPLGPG